MRSVIGTMTGTSMDGVDAVATVIEGQGLSMNATFRKIATEPIDNIQDQLRIIASGNRCADEMTSVAFHLGQSTAIAITKLGISDIDLIALHGQTVFHEPPSSVQLLNPEPVVERFNCVVLTDPRAADLQLGGQGAPITPLADWIMFRQQSKSVAVVNLGGFCNITILPSNGEPRDILGFDLCCCNLLLDAIARDRLGIPFDQDGNLATSGTVDEPLLFKLKSKIKEQHDQHRSLGSSDDLGLWVLDQGAGIQTNDLLATATHAIGSYICETVQGVDQVLVAGGGVQNTALLFAIGESAQKTDRYGVPTQAREAMAMAILGALATDGVSITLPHITGRQETDSVVGWTQASP